VQRVIGLKALGYSALFIPTLIFTGGFVSPFVVVYLLMTLLVSSMIDVIPKRIGQVVVTFLVGSYAGVSLIQKAGYIPSYVSYIEPLLQNDQFFWMVFAVTLLCLIGGTYMMGTTHRNIRDTITQMVTIHRHVAKGTAGYTGASMLTQMVGSLCEALDAECGFLVEWYNRDQNSGARLFLCRHGKTLNEDIKFPAERKDAIGKNMGAHAHPVKHLNLSFDDIVGYPLSKSHGYFIPVILSDKTPVGLLAIAHDKHLSAEPIVDDILTVFAARGATELERIEAERRNIKMQNMLAYGQKMHTIGQLAGGLTHDFNNYINGIMGFAYLIKRKSSTETPGYIYAEKIESIAKVASNLSTQLLTFSRKSNQNYSMIDMHQLIRNLTVILKHTLPRNVTLVTHPESEHEVIYGDHSIIQSALLNCALNARDAMKQGGTLTIKTEAVEVGKKCFTCCASGKQVTTGRYFCVTFSDTGSGIPREIISRIFEPFFTTKNVSDGTGIGLVQVGRCLHNHGGFIRVDSEIGKGSTFRLHFPLDRHEENADEYIQRPDCRDKHSRISALERAMDKRMFSIWEANKFRETEKLENNNPHLPTVLVADSSSYQLEMLMSCLYQEFNLFQARNATECLEKYQANQTVISAIVSDYNMHVMNDFKFCKYLKENKSLIPVVLLSGRFKESDKMQAFECGATHCLDRPFDVGELIHIVRKNIESSG
ncbi:MAG: ATP-binding protein, partial [Chitinivibrionales bacterium]